MPKPSLARLCIAAAFSLIAAACEESGESRGGKLAKYASYKDVPGITAEEIKAVEELKAKNISFAYGAQTSTEAFLSKDGEPKGFSALLCKWLTEMFGMQFNLEFYEWGDLIAGLESGKVDFTGEMTASEERRKSYLMTDAIADRPLIAIRIKGGESFDEIAKQRELRFAFLSGTTTIDDIKSSLKHKDFEIFLVDEYEAAYEMLKNGEADAFFDEKPGEAAFEAHGDAVANDVFPMIYSPVSLTAQKKELAPIISVVQKILQSESASQFIEMYNAGYKEYTKHKFFASLSKEENDYIKKHPVVPFAAETDNYPISFYNDHISDWQGINIDVIKAIEQLAGITFVIVNSKDAKFPELLKMLENEEAFAITELIRSENREGHFLWPSSSLMCDNYVLVSKAERPDINLNEISSVKIGLIKGAAYTDIFKKWFPKHSNSIEYEDTQASFKALQRGEIDMVMTTHHEYLNLTNYQELTGFKTNLMFDYIYESTFGIGKNQSELRSIFDKAILLIDVKNISSQWMHKTYDYKIKMANARIPWIIGITALLCSLAIMVVLLKTKQKEGRRLEKIAQNRTSEIFAIYSSIPDIIFTMNTDYVYTSCNPSFEIFSGKDIENIIGKTDYDVFDASDKNMVDRFIKINKQVLDTMEIVIVQEHVFNAKGDERILETIKSPLFQNDKLTGIIGIARDITAHKKAEEEALEASKAKSVFLANMSHEIRTPMNAIIGMSELLEHESLNERQRNYVADINLAAHSLLSIINDILDMSKIESGKLTLNPIDYDFYALEDNIKSIFEFVAQKKGIEFVLEKEGEVPHYLFGDDIRLKQVLTNICGNAVKFTEKGYVKLKISSTDNQLVFEISDTGAGIRKEEIPKLFNAFSQADTLKNRGIIGTGLGLSISKSFIEMMGGQIAIDSEYGKGTVFTVVVPLVEGSKENIARSEKEKKEQKLEAPDANVLVVDDNEFNLKVASGLLGLLKIEIETASSGKDAIEMVRRKQYDIVFMDHMMPEMDGVEATGIIRSFGGEYESLPIIALTANAVQGSKEMFLLNGFNDFLSKPIDMHELGRVIKEWLPPGKIKGSDASASPSEEEAEPQSSFLGALKGIPEINAEIGMERFSCIEDMYRDAFELFYKKLAEENANMSAFLSGGDMRNFSIAVHAMKSALATVGIMGLSEKAHKLEMASKNDEPDFCMEHFPELNEKLLSLCERLSGIFAGVAGSAEKKPADMAYLKESIQAALAAAGDFDNYAGAEALKKLLSYDFSDEIAASLEKAVKSFDELDFDGAVEILNKVDC